MIEKFYEVRCDFCGTVINHYPKIRPTRERIEKIVGVRCTATKHFCSDVCYANWKHDCQERMYMNLRQNGRIHNNG